MELIDKINFLLESADPQRSVYSRLIKLRGLVEQRVMLNASDRAFLASVQAKHDNVDCAYVSQAGACRAPSVRYDKYGERCKFIQNYSRCPLYKKSKSKMRVDPLRYVGF